jgi:hypothetical protein
VSSSSFSVVVTDNKLTVSTFAGVQKHFRKNVTLDAVPLKSICGDGSKFVVEGILSPEFVNIIVLPDYVPGSTECMPWFPCLASSMRHRFVVRWYLTFANRNVVLIIIGELS